MRPVRLLPSVGVIGLLLACPALFAQNDKPPEKPADPPTPDVKKDEPKTEAKKEEPKPDPRVAAQQRADTKALEGAGLSADDPAGLMKYLKARSLSPADIGKITAVIQKMHSDAPFDDRVAAQEEVLKMGGTAVDVLKKMAKESTDAEIQYRAKDTLRRLEKEKQYGAEVTAAAVRALGKVKSEEAAEVLFGFLPLADTAALVELIQEAVSANAGKDGKPAKVLVDALTDASAQRRQVAAVALASGGTAGQRVRFQDVYPKLVEMAKADKDKGLRFAVAKALLLDSREKAAVGVLIDLMPDMTRGQSWQAEELLAQVAGKDAPKERCKHSRDPGTNKDTTASRDARVKCRDAWKKWWEGAAAKADLEKAEVKLTVRGELIVITQGWSNQQQVNLIEYAPDEKEKGRVTFSNPAGNLFDAVIRDDGKILSLDQYNNQVQVRDAGGKQTATWVVPDKNARNFGFQAKGMELLPNGHLIAVHQNGFTEFDKDGKTVLSYSRPEVNKGQPKNDLYGAVRMKNGETVLLVTAANQNASELLVLDAKGKEVADRKPVKAGAPYYRNTLVQSGDDKVMVYEQGSNRMQEYDLKTGKSEAAKWTNVGQPLSIQRLPNGNLLTAEYGRLVERAPDGTEVWSMSNRDSSGNTQFVRAYVR
jgi:hypothetical protein